MSEIVYWSFLLLALCACGREEPEGVRVHDPAGRAVLVKGGEVSLNPGSTELELAPGVPAVWQGYGGAGAVELDDGYKLELTDGPLSNSMTMPLFVEEPGVLELRGEVEVLEGDVSARLWVREWLHESAGEDSSGDAILTKVHVRKWVHSGQGERTVQVLCALPARTKVDLYFLVANTANPQASGAASFRDLRVLLR